MGKWFSDLPRQSEQDSPYKATIAIERDRYDFLTALWRVCRDKRDPPLDRNPVQTLLTRAEEWRRVRDSVRAKYSQPGTRRFYGESSELQDGLNGIVSAWASEFLLVCGGQPATWIVDHARRYLNGDQFRYQPIDEPRPRPEFSLPPPPFLPSRHPGEGDRAFGKRLLEAAKDFECERKTLSRRAKSVRQKTPGRPPGSGDPLSHEALIYLLCGTPRKSVADQLHITSSAVTKRAQKVARTLGLDYPTLPLVAIR